MTTFDLRIEQGSDYRVRFQLKDAEGAEADLSGLTVRGHVRRFVTSQDVLLDLADYITVEGNSIDLHLPHSVTSDLTPYGAVYDLELVGVDEVRRLLQGDVHISREVTR